MTIAFTETYNAYSWLSNLSRHPVRKDGLVWVNAEVLFQAMRFSEDEKFLKSLRKIKDPVKALAVLRDNEKKMVIDKTSNQDIENMNSVLKWKLETNPLLVDRLIQTGSERIVADNTGRQYGSAFFWGQAKSEGRWVGKNMLGKLWMNIRNDMRKENNES